MTYIPNTSVSMSRTNEKKEEIEYIYKTDKQGTRVTCRCIPIKGQTRELPEIEHARPDLAKRSRITRFISTLYAMDESHTHKYFQKFTASSVCCIALISFLILTN